jgi:hypothetical protein
VFGLKVFSTVLPNSTGLGFGLCDVLGIFNSPTHFHLKQGLSDVLLFVIPFFVFDVLEYFSTVYPIHL